MKITSDDIYNLLRQGESISVEMKKCSDKLPRSVWETYSAFANSRGGVILLGFLYPDLKELDDVKEVWLSLPLVRASKSNEGTSKTDSTVNSTVKSAFGDINSIEGQVNDSLGQEKGQENRSKGQENQDLGQVNTIQGHETEILGQVNEIMVQVNKQENLSDKQKEILIYLLKHPSESLKNCSDATGASAKSIRYTFRKVSSWLDIHHEGPDKTGIWRFELIKSD